MSHDAAAWALRAKGLTSGQKMVLNQLANRCNEGHEGWEGQSVCWPSLRLLASDAELSVRGLTKILKGLEDAGAIVRIHDHGYGKATGNGGESTIYELPLGREPQFRREPADLGNKSAQGRELIGTKVGNPSSHKPVIEPVIEPVSTPHSPPKRKYSPDFEEFWQAYPKNGRVAKPQCFKKYTAAVDSGEVGRAEILAAVCRYGTSKQVQDGFICHMQTWLNQERWNHDFEQPKSRYTAAIDKFIAG